MPILSFAMPSPLELIILAILLLIPLAIIALFVRLIVSLNRGKGRGFEVSPPPDPSAISRDQPPKSNNSD